MIKIGNQEFRIPTGFAHITWDKVEVGAEVYTVASWRGDPRAYGPHTVFDNCRRLLKNKSRRAFPEPHESLLVKIDPEEEKRKIREEVLDRLFEPIAKDKYMQYYHIQVVKRRDKILLLLPFLSDEEEKRANEWLENHK